MSSTFVNLSAPYTISPPQNFQASAASSNVSEANATSEARNMRWGSECNEHNVSPPPPGWPAGVPSQTGATNCGPPRAFAGRTTESLKVDGGGVPAAQIVKGQISAMTSQFSRWEVEEKLEKDHLRACYSDQPNIVIVSSSNQATPSVSDIESDSTYKELDKPVGKDGYFRLKNLMVHLTYSYHIMNEQAYLNEINRRLNVKNSEIKVWSVVRELGKGKDGAIPHAHTHVAIHFSKAPIVTDPRFFDYKENDQQEPHPNIKKVAVKKHWDYICGTYHRKDGVPFTNYVCSSSMNPTLEEIQACPTKHDVVKMMSEKGNILKSGPALQAWEHRDAPKKAKVLMGHKPLQWQQFILNHIENEFYDDRSIIWSYDEPGDSGKTWITNYIIENHNGYVLTTANNKDGLHALKEHILKHGEPSIIIVDMVRASNVDAIYGMIEVIKDGRYTSGKYNSDSVTFSRNPIVLVFSNSPPIPGKLSLDRWIVTIPNFNGRRFDYTYTGKAGRQVLDEYINHERAKQAIAAEMDIKYEPCIPFGERMKIEHFTSTIEYLSVARRRVYWDRHKIPRIIVDCKPNLQIMGQQHVTIEERDMSAEEIEEYKEWVIKFGNHVEVLPERDLVREDHYKKKSAEGLERFKLGLLKAMSK